MVEGRIAERRAEVRSARRRARLRRTIVVALLVLLAAVATWFSQSEHAQVRTLLVEGVVRLDADEVEAASGVEVGDSALLLRTTQVARTLEELPLVRSAEVSRRRLRDVVLRVVERAPIYAVAYRDESVLMIGRGRVGKE